MDPAVDKAFDPHSQIAMVPGTVLQRPHANLMGVVPITAGPTVPLVTLDAPSLQAIPGQHWLAILDLTNSSANTVDAVVDCHFTNHGAKVGVGCASPGAAGQAPANDWACLCAARVPFCLSTR